MTPSRFQDERDPLYQLRLKLEFEAEWYEPYRLNKYNKRKKDCKMMDEIHIKLDSNSLTKLLHTNLATHLGKTLTQEVLNHVTKEIIESIDFFLNKHVE